jgi:putative transposase
MIKLDNQTYQLNYMMLRIPVKPREFILIPLKGGEYQLSYLRDETLKRGSVTITPSKIIVAVSKETADVAEPLRKVAYDINEKNIVGVTSDGKTIKYELPKLARIRTEYAERRSKFQKKKPHDRRVKQKVLSKLGRREKERAKRILHNISKAIVEHAKKSEAAIVLEKLRGILFSHRRGDGESRTMRARLHRWSFRELQRQIEYKAKWEGIKIEYVNAANTSKTCSNCGYVNKALKNERGWLCPSCGAILDRDVNAAKNILSRSKLVCLPVVRGGAPSK